LKKKTISIIIIIIIITSSPFSFICCLSATAIALYYSLISSFVCIIINGISRDYNSCRV
jgi:hypothetical protein